MGYFSASYFKDFQQWVQHIGHSTKTAPLSIKCKKYFLSQDKHIKLVLLDLHHFDSLIR